MANTDKGGAKRKTKIGGQFAWRLIEMQRSPAVRVASLTLNRIMNCLEIDLAENGGLDNGNLIKTYAQLEEYGCDRHAIAPAIYEGVALGLLAVTEQGRAGNAEYRTPTLYRLTYRHTKDAEPTDDWKKIETIEEARRLAHGARKIKLGKKHPKKQKASGGKQPRPVGKSHTEKAKAPVGETHTTVPVGETHTTLDILGRDHAAAKPAPVPRPVPRRSVFDAIALGVTAAANVHVSNAAQPSSAGRRPQGSASPSAPDAKPYDLSAVRNGTRFTRGARS